MEPGNADARCRGMNNVLVGCLAGTVATFAMTAAMATLKRRLPPQERYPLPPREITQGLLDRTHAGQALTVDTKVDASLAAHFGFGAVAGALYGAAVRRPAAGSAVLYGLGVWTASYLGWVPGLRILTPATRHPARRNALMIAVHVVWGAALGLAARELQRDEDVFRTA